MPPCAVPMSRVANLLTSGAMFQKTMRRSDRPPVAVRRRASSAQRALNPRALNVLNEEAENNPQFQATKLWNRITRKFCQDVPRKRHWRGLRPYDDSFTGREAVEFLLEVLPNLMDEDKEVTRPKCILLLEKFFENDIVRHVREDQAVGFKDSTDLYKLSPAAEEIALSSRVTRRASSFNDKKRKYSWQQQGSSSTPKIEPLPPMVIPTSPSKLAKTRRLSMSHGNLTSLNDNHETSHLHNSSLKVPKDLSFITENIASPRACIPSTSTKPDSAVRLLPVIRTEVDLFQLWKHCLLEQLEKILEAEDIPNELRGRMIGADVKWNAECVGSRGIVKARNDEGEFPTILMKMMRYVARYPFDQSQDLAKVSYRGMEVDTFSNICHELSKLNQLLPHETAKALLQVVSIFVERSKARTAEEDAAQDDNNEVFEDASENFVPIRRAPFTRAQANRASMSVLSPRNLPSTPLSRYRNTETVRSLQMPGSPVSSRKHTARCMTETGLQYKRLPGLIQSPELLEQIDELTRGSSSLSSGTDCSYRQAVASISRSPYRPPSVGQSALVCGVRDDIVDELMTAMSLILLALPPSTRRRLHFVVRFMQRVSSNNCLRLNDFKENRYVVLERLASCIIQATQSPDVPPAKAIQLVTFLMDHESKVFSVPELLLKAVADAVKPSSESSVTPAKSVASSAPDVSPDRQFCAVIDKTVYDSQKNDESNIRDLLAQICENQAFSEDHRKKCLQNFKKTYPAIYKERFPSPEEVALAERRTPIPRFLNKLINMRLKN